MDPGRSFAGDRDPGMRRYVSRPNSGGQGVGSTAHGHHHCYPLDFRPGHGGLHSVLLYQKQAEEEEEGGTNGRATKPKLVYHQSTSDIFITIRKSSILEDFSH